MSKILRHIDIDLTPESIKHAIHEIELLEKQLEEQMLDLVQALVSEGIEIAKMQVISMDALWTGYLEQSIQGVFFREEGCGVIFSDVPQAMYVEYGTGIEGVITPYEGDLKGYEPDAMKHGSNGWWILHHGDGGFQRQGSMPDLLWLGQKVCRPDRSC